MPIYGVISDTWFKLRFPVTQTYDDFEHEPGIEDRLATKSLFERMRTEAPRTAERLLRIDRFPLDFSAIRQLDAQLTPTVAEEWMRESDPDDPNNEFRLTVSEFSVHVGQVLVDTLHGAWLYARFPNYFQSTIRAGTLEFLVFDAVMKKCSTDFGTESLLEKCRQFSIAASGEKMRSIQ